MLHTNDHYTEEIFKNVNVLIHGWVLFLFSCSTELASGIVSTSLQCGSERCPTDDVALNTPIRVYFEHSDPTKVNNVHVARFLHFMIISIQEAMLRGDDSEITCVFWDFLSERR